MALKYWNEMLSLSHRSAKLPVRDKRKIIGVASARLSSISRARMIASIINILDVSANIKIAISAI